MNILKSFENEMIGNKTLCDICSSKAMRKARLKKEKETSTQTPNIEPSTETADESAPTTAPPTTSMPTQHHHDEGIIPKWMWFRIPESPSKTIKPQSTQPIPTKYAFSIWLWLTAPRAIVNCLAKQQQSTTNEAHWIKKPMSTNA